MVITKKDKNLLFLVLSLIIVFWFAFISISYLFKSLTSNNIQIKNIANQNADWLNASRKIKTEDLKNRIILLDFWTYACVNCLHIIPEIKKLEAEFGDRLTVIGVHSGKFNNEKETVSIKSAILKYDISHLVVNDSDFKIWNSFAVSSWPTIILLDPKGNIVKKYQGEVSDLDIRDSIANLIKKYKYQLSKDKLPIILEKNKAVNYILKFPAKIKFARDFSYKNINKTNAIIISNTGKNNIIVASLNGETLLEIGSGIIGFEDGNINNATFNFPQGLLFKDNTLYVADTGNHALRKVDFKTGEVTTLSGNGKRGDIITTQNKAIDTSLASPWDLEFFPDQNTIIIANAGTHQLLKYDTSKQTVRPFAGNGSEDLIDGIYPNNSLAQPSGLSAADGKLYFVDSESSSLRVVGENDEIKTLVGQGLFNFGNKNGIYTEALMQHPIGLTADDTAVYIVDTHNHIIRKYNLKTGDLSTYSGSIRGDGFGIKGQISYNEPEAIISVMDKFYIADTNNNRIVELDANNGSSKLLNIIPKAQMPSDGLLEYLPNLTKITTKVVAKDSKISLAFNLRKGWKINDSAPSFFNLVEIKNTKEANLIASFDGEMIKSGAVLLPKLSDKNQYYLQGTVYYCQDIADALCLVKSYEQQLKPTKLGPKKIEIDFTYQ